MIFIVLVQVFLIYYGGHVFRTSGLTLFEFELMIMFAITVIPFDWIRKLILKYKGKNDTIQAKRNGSSLNYSL